MSHIPSSGLPAWAYFSHGNASDTEGAVNQIAAVAAAQEAPPKYLVALDLGCHLLLGWVAHWKSLITVKLEIST